jgi:hypothetical protein
VARTLALITALAVLLAAAADAGSAVAKRHHHRPGCGKFCRQAGGFGGGPETSVPVKIGKQTVRVDSDGVVGIKARCTLDKRCDGAILIASQATDSEYGRANLKIGAHKTRVVRVLIKRKWRQFLKQVGGDDDCFATVPLKTDDPVSIGRHITLLPHR